MGVSERLECLFGWSEDEFARPAQFHGLGLDPAVGDEALSEPVAGADAEAKACVSLFYAVLRVSEYVEQEGAHLFIELLMPDWNLRNLSPTFNPGLFLAGTGGICSHTCSQVFVGYGSFLQRYEGELDEEGLSPAVLQFYDALSHAQHAEVFFVVVIELAERGGGSDIGGAFEIHADACVAVAKRSPGNERRVLVDDKHGDADFSALAHEHFHHRFGSAPLLAVEEVVRLFHDDDEA